MRELLGRKSRILACLLVLPGCVQDAGPPPAGGPDTDREWMSSKYGFVFTTYYFTKAQVNDPNWEAKRLESIETASFCEGGKHVIRRDIRWFPATSVSGRVCAALIYTVQCDVPTHATRDGFARDRRESLMGELDGVLEKGCGEKDPARRTPSDYRIRQYQETQALLVDGQTCDLRLRTLDGAVRLTPATRISITHKIDRAFAARLGHPVDDRFTTVIRDTLKVALFSADKVEGIFPTSGTVSDSPDNIRVELALGLNEGGRPYCVQLTARQGNRVWRRTIERLQPPGDRPLALFQHDRGGDSPMPGDDATTLADALRASLGLPDADPTQES